MSSNLLKEIEAKMDAFFAYATDQEFWAALKHIHDKGYSSINVPVLEIHDEFAKEIVTSHVCLRVEGTTAQQRGFSFSSVDHVFHDQSLTEIMWGAAGNANPGRYGAWAA
jgi:hypothetical protein